MIFEDMIREYAGGLLESRFDMNIIFTDGGLRRRWPNLKKILAKHGATVTHDYLEGMYSARFETPREVVILPFMSLKTLNETLGCSELVMFNLDLNKDIVETCDSLGEPTPDEFIDYFILGVGAVAQEVVLWLPL